MQRWLLVGGDRRAEHLEKLLKQDGYEVNTLGLHAGDEHSAEVGKADVLLFPYPFSVRNGCVPTLTGLTLHPEDVLAKQKTDAVLLTGRGLEGRSYMESTTLEMRNAEISAEAAVCEAMQRLDMALMDAKLAVVGYGRFGRALALRLHALGAQVHVAARREEQRQLALEDGMQALSIADLPKVLGEVDMVLNTVPAQVLSREALNALKPGTWLLELASAPYGFDRAMAIKIGLRCEVLPALPARYAPQSAALALRAAIRELLEV